jgi:outer membrane biosynthesis protein TonB
MSDESALNDAAYRDENAVAQHRQRREAAERDNQKLQKRVTAAIADAKAERQRREELEVENEQLQRQLLEAKERVAQLEREKAQEDAQPDVRESQPEPQPPEPQPETQPETQPEPQPPEPQPEPQPETQPEPQLAPRRSPGGRKPEPQLALRRSPGERKLEQHPDAAKVQPAVAGPEVQPGVAPADLPQPLFNGLWHARGDFDGHDQNPFNESFVLYEDPRSGKLSGVSYFGKRCNDAGYPPPPVPELFTISGETDVSDGQRTECRFTQTFVDEESGIEQTVWHGKLVEGEVTAIRGKWRSKASGQSGTFEAVEDLGVFPTVLLRLDMSGPYVEQETSPGPEPELVEEAKAVLLQQLRDQVKAEHLDDEDDLLECIQTLQVHVDSGTGPFDISIRIGFSPQSLIVAQSLSAQVDYFREKATAGHVAILVGPKRFTSRGLETDFFETGTHGKEWASFHHELSRATAAHPHSQEPSGLLDSLQQQGKMAERDDPTLATMTNSSVPYVQQHLRSDGQLSHSTHHLRIIPGYEDSSHIQPTHSVSTYQSPIEVPAWDKLRAELEELRPHALVRSTMCPVGNRTIG